MLSTRIEIYMETLSIAVLKVKIQIEYPLFIEHRITVVYKPNEVIERN